MSAFASVTRTEDLHPYECGGQGKCSRCDGERETLRAALVKCEFALTLLLGGCPSQAAEEEAAMAARQALKVEGDK